MKDVLRTFVSVALALVTMGAPIAAQACEATCAGRDAQAGAASAPNHHSCHQEATPSGISLIAVHRCGHTDGTPSGEGVVKVVALPAIVPATIFSIPSSEATPPPIDRVASRPPNSYSLITQLRT